MNIQWWQILLITLYAGFAFYDGNNTTFGTVKPTMAGFFAGLVLGDVTTGLVVGGTLNLLVLGIGNFGGASIPDYMTGALLGTAFAIQSGQGAEFGVTLAIFATLSSDEFKKTAAAKKNLCGCRSNWRLEAKKSPVVPGK